MSIPNFLGAFYFYKTETLTDCNGRNVDIECQEADALALPTGRIVACDGLIPSLEPFAEAVTPGTYPVILSMAIFDYSYWIACAMLRFSDAMPVSWKSADPSDQNKLHGIGYGVDTGTGCFADLSAMKILSADEAKYKQLKERVCQPNSDWINFRVDDRCNVIVFSSGAGDGRYPSYFGYDAEGNLVCLATDFGIIAPLPGEPAETPSKLQLKLDF